MPNNASGSPEYGSLVAGALNAGSIGVAGSAGGAISGEGVFVMT
jgi:hypothetical protein